MTAVIPSRYVDAPPRESWALVERAQSGDREALAEIYRQTRPDVLRFVNSRCGGDPQLAEDLTADTFVRALKSLERITWQGRDIRAWLITIARNLIADYYKSGRYRMEYPANGHHAADGMIEDRWLGGIDDSAEGRPEDTVLDALTNITLHAAVTALNPEQRECIVLRFLQGFSVAETARAMGKNEGAVKALQWRAISALARQLGDGIDHRGAPPRRIKDRSRA